jgi:hypothetical protein
MSIQIGTRRWLPSRRLARRSRGPLLGGIWLRLVTKSRASDLDHQLANGTDPMLSDELSLRVGQLGSAGTRVLLASVLREAIKMANGSHAPLLTTRLRLMEIREHELLLTALADRVCNGEPVGVQGLAMTSRLVHDRSSALYRSGTSSSLQDAASQALAALERGHRTASTTVP